MRGKTWQNTILMGTWKVQVPQMLEKGVPANICKYPTKYTMVYYYQWLPSIYHEFNAFGPIRTQL